MVNCGLCGQPLYNPGQVICDKCKKASSRHKSKNAERMNRRQEQEQDMFMNIARPGMDEDVVEDMRYQHYVDSHDASAVWVDEDKPRKRGRRR